MSKSNVTQKPKVSKLKKWGKNIATRTHNLGWLAGAFAILMIFIADGYFNAWMGSLLGGSMLAILYVGVEFGMFYCLGEVAEGFKKRATNPIGLVRGGLCLIGFLLGVFCSYKALITYNAYWDARRGADYTEVDSLSEKHDFLFWQQAIMLFSGNPDNAVKVKDTMIEDYDRRISKESDARTELGYAPELAIFYQNETLTGDEDRDRLVHKRALDKASSLRNSMTLCGILIAVILTFVFVTDYTVCDEEDMESLADNARDDDEAEAHLLNDHPKPKTARVRVPAGADVFAHPKPSMWQRLRGKAA